MHLTSIPLVMFPFQTSSG